MGYMASPRDEIRSLFLDGPPPTPEEVRRLLGGLSKEGVHGALICMIRNDELTQHHFGLFVEIAKQFDISTVHADELLALAKNSLLPMTARKFAVVALTTTSSADALTQWLNQLDPPLVVAASDMPFVDMLTAIQMDPSISADLTEVLLEASPEEREFVLLHHIGRIRREVGTPATLAYRSPLAEPALLDIHQHMIDAIVQERDSSAIDLLTMLRDTAVCDESRKRFQLALLRMGTKQIEDSPGRNTPDAEAFVSICGGQGAFFLVCRHRLSEQHCTTVTCCIRAAGEIRDAFVFPQHEEDDFNNLLDEMATEHLAHTEISLGEAATIFNEALCRTKALAQTLPTSMLPVMSFFERIEPVPLTDIGPVSCGESVEALEKLMDLSHYCSWFFDAGDLTGHGILPPDGEATESWYQNAAKQLSCTPLKERLLGMLTHMARWHTWNGDDEAASLCESARVSVQNDFSRSALVHLMLERSLLTGPEAFDVLLEDVDQSPRFYGDTALRTVLKRRFFSTLKRPAGRHVAELDFTEVGFNQLQLAFAQLPGEKRPREDDVLDISKEIASVVVQGMLKDSHVESMMQQIDKTLSNKTTLFWDERVEVAANVMEGIFAFVDSACQRCPSQCLQYPRKGMADVFFSKRHPALE
jgi:hypothetical protein